MQRHLGLRDHAKYRLINEPARRGLSYNKTSGARSKKVWQYCQEGNQNDYQLLQLSTFVDQKLFDCEIKV